MNYSNIGSHLILGLPEGMFPIGLTVEILKAPFYSILSTFTAHICFLNIITHQILGELYTL